MVYSKSNIGFSTGSISKGNFEEAINILQLKKIRTVELSALRENEVFLFERKLNDLNLNYFHYISFHAPSKLKELTEEELVGFLIKLKKYSWPIIVHPDIITDYRLWKRLGNQLCIENMDKRKSIGKTYQDMCYLFENLPDASFCLDLAHAKQVDPTLEEAILMITKLGSRLKQIHLSEVNTASKHERLSFESIVAFANISNFIPSTIPIILESPVSSNQINSEVESASLIFDSKKLINLIEPYKYFSNYFFNNYHSIKKLDTFSIK